MVPCPSHSVVQDKLVSEKLEGLPTAAPNVVPEKVQLQQEKTATPNQLQNLGITLDHDKAARILLNYPLKETIIK
ncbi:hypothetical protein VNO78_33263 [Psophocarpus tetragonolobus]|uniref:Uncharacterized protein n=1 Tax=Psophocarpus tetragonolobus TaxID=3891 RepID=A0AAN9NX24_PSOTE